MEDCRIDFETYVYDALLDEGRAQTDPSDQRVTVSLIVEQSRNTREASLAVGSQLENPRYQLQLERASRPPVPAFPRLPSSLGKRPYAPADTQASVTNGTKRARHAGIPETESEEQELQSSIEHYEPLESVEMVKGTQYSLPEQEQPPQQDLVAPKDESPPLQRLLHNVPQATNDELEILPERPADFVPSKKGKKESSKTQSSRTPRKPEGTYPSTTNSVQRPQKASQVPITPPSDSARRQSDSSSIHRQRSGDATNSAAQLLSLSGSKFKLQNIFDYPESEIDDSQMSPRSKQGQPSDRKSNDRLSRIERLQSPQLEKGEHELSVSQAIDTLDDGSVFDDDRPINESFKTPEDNSRKASSSSNGLLGTSIYEDVLNEDGGALAQMDSAAGHEAAPRTVQVVSAKEKKTSKPATSKLEQNSAPTKSPEKHASSMKEGALAKKWPSSMPGGEDAGVKPPKRRRVSRRDDSMSIDGDSLSNINGSENGIDRSVEKDGTKMVTNETKTIKKPKGSRVSLDSPGEQLSQDLQESTQKLSMKAVTKKLVDAQKRPQSAKPGKEHTQVPEGGSSTKATMKTSHGSASKQNTSTGTAKGMVKEQEAGGAASSTTPNIAVQRAEQSGQSSPALPKSLPKWGSGGPAVNPKGKSAGGSNNDNLSVEQRDELRSPSVGAGLTAEEIKIMESRKNMTKEEYEAEKKRKLRESKKEQRKQEAVAKKKPTVDQTSSNKIPNANVSTVAETKPAEAVSKKHAPESLPAMVASRQSLERTPTQTSNARSGTGDTKLATESVHVGKDNTVRRESSFSKPSDSAPMLPPKTPASATTKSASVKSASTTKTPKPATQLEKAAKTPNTVSKKSTPAPTSKPAAQQEKVAKTPNTVSKKSAPASASKATGQQGQATTSSDTVSKKSTPVSTSKPDSKSITNSQVNTPQAARPYKQTLSGLRAGLLSANNKPEAQKGTLLSRIKGSQKSPSFHIEDEDDEDEESDSSDEEEQKPAVVSRPVATQSKTTVPSKQRLSSDEDSEDDDDDQESSDEEKDNKKSKNSKTKTLGRPDSQIRDKSVELDDEDEDEDEDD